MCTHRKQTGRRGSGVRLYTLSKTDPIDQFLPARLHHPKVWKPPQTIILTRDPVFKYMNLWSIFLIETTALFTNLI